MRVFTLRVPYSLAGVKTALIVVGGLLGLCVALFVGSAIVVGILRAEGVIKPSEDRGQSRPSADRGREAGSRRGRDSLPGRPLVRVTRVIDGDTVDTDRLGRVRLIGVDTPEEGRCFNTAATRFTRQRLSGKVVGYELGVERKDRYGRTLAYLYRDDLMHDLDLARNGYAKVLTIRPNDKYAGAFRRAAQRARLKNAGVWGICERLAREARARRHAREARQRRLAREARERRAARERNSRRHVAPDRSGGNGGGEDHFDIPFVPGD